VGRVNGPVQGYYRVHGANMHLTAYAGVATDMRARAETFERFFADRSGAMTDAARLHQRARRAIAEDALRTATVVAASAEGPLAADEFAVFAASAYPPIRRSRVWRRYAHRRRHPAGAVRRLVDAKAHEVRWSLRWRRWRRYGT
jgi:hypothetical protein